MKKKYVTLFKEDGLSIVLDTNNKQLRIGIPGYSIEKSFELWVKEDKTYANAILVGELNRLKAFYDYFSELYGTGLEISNWHLNGEIEPFDNFFEDAERGE